MTVMTLMTVKYGPFLKGDARRDIRYPSPGSVAPTPRLLPVPSASAYNAGMRAHDLRSLQGDRADSVAWAKGRYYLDECCEVWGAKEGERVA